MGAWIQFQIGPDGDLSIVIHKDLWHELSKDGAAVPLDDGTFVRISLTGLAGENRLALAATPGSDNFPCRPVFQFVLA